MELFFVMSLSKAQKSVPELFHKVLNRMTSMVLYIINVPNM